MYLVFDVGGTFIKYALMDQKGKIYEKYKVPTPFQDGKVDDNGDEITPYTVKTEDGIAAFLEQIDIIYGKYSKEYQITGIAMSLPGQVNVNQGIVYGGGSLPYLDRVPLGNLISRRCGNVPVALEMMQSAPHLQRSGLETPRIAKMPACLCLVPELVAVLLLTGRCAMVSA